MSHEFSIEGHVPLGSLRNFSCPALRWGVHVAYVDFPRPPLRDERYFAAALAVLRDGVAFATAGGAEGSVALPPAFVIEEPVRNETHSWLGPPLTICPRLGLF